jgi:hypothetical protein
MKEEIVETKSSVRDIKEAIPKTHGCDTDYLLDIISGKMQKNDRKRIAVKLTNYYPNENPEFFYQDDSEIYIALRQTYGKVAILNDTYESEDDHYHRYNLINPEKYHIVECGNDAGNRTTRSEYNDEDYDKIHTHYLTYLVIDPANVKA